MNLYSWQAFIYYVFAHSIKRCDLEGLSLWRGINNVGLTSDEEDHEEHKKDYSLYSLELDEDIASSQESRRVGS